MMANWQYKKLGDICSVFTDGNWIESKDQSPEGIRLIQTGNIGNGVFKDKGDKARYISEETFDRLSCTEIFEGDVLVSRLPEPIGRSCILPKLDQRTITAVDCSILRFKDELLNKFFVFYTLSPAYDRALKNYITGSSRKRISRSNLSLIKVPVPSIEEQQRIVDELDLLSGIIDKKNAQLRDLDALAQSIFYEMFGDPSEPKYPVAKLSSLATGKLSYGSGASAIDFDGNTRYIRITDIQEDGRLSPEAMSPSQSDAKYLLNDGDILFARSGATVGKTYLYDSKDGHAIYAGYLIRFVPNQEIVLPEYIYHFTRSHYYKTFIASNAQAVAQPNINAQQYGNLNVCIPPISVQKAFAQKIRFLESKRELICSSLKDTQTLLDSRMSHYFD